MSVDLVGGQLGGAKALGGWRRSELKASTLAAIEAFPDDVRAEFIQPRFVLRFLSAIEAGLGQCDRTAMTIYAQSMKLLGEEKNLALQIVNVIGTQPAVARASVESIDRARMMTPRQRLEAHARALRDAGWKLEPPADWSDVEVLTNGNGNHP